MIRARLLLIVSLLVLPGPPALHAQQPIGARSSLGDCNGRLTLTTATPITTADVTAATTLYFTPFRGNRCALYNGTAWIERTLAEVSIAVPATTSQMYDVWLYNNAGTAALELLAWTNDTTRATALTTQDGVYVKTGALTRRYVGSFRTTTVSGQTEDSLAKRFVWNYYNRVRRSLRITEATDAWSYSLAVIRQAGASSGSQVALITGVAETAVTLQVIASGSSDAAGDSLWVGIGEDSTTTMATGCLAAVTAVKVANSTTALQASLTKIPTVGYHMYAWLERAGAVGTGSWNGDAGVPTLYQSGIHGQLDN